MRRRTLLPPHLLLALALLLPSAAHPQLASADEPRFSVELEAGPGLAGAQRHPDTERRDRDSLRARRRDRLRAVSLDPGDVRLEDQAAPQRSAAGGAVLADRVRISCGAGPVRGRELRPRHTRGGRVRLQLLARDLSLPSRRAPELGVVAGIHGQGARRRSPTPAGFDQQPRYRHRVRSPAPRDGTTSARRALAPPPRARRPRRRPPVGPSTWRPSSPTTSTHAGACRPATALSRGAPTRTTSTASAGSTTRRSRRPRASRQSGLQPDRNRLPKRGTSVARSASYE